MEQRRPVEGMGELGHLNPAHLAAVMSGPPGTPGAEDFEAVGAGKGVDGAQRALEMAQGQEGATGEADSS